MGGCGGGSAPPAYVTTGILFSIRSAAPFFKFGAFFLNFALHGWRRSREILFTVSVFLPPHPTAREARHFKKLGRL